MLIIFTLHNTIIINISSQAFVWLFFEIRLTFFFMGLLNNYAGKKEIIT